MDIKCKHCRKRLFNEESVHLFNAHSEIKKNSADIGCKIDDPDSCSYLLPEKMPEWIEHVVNQESWIKGRLHCPYCKNRVGSFNFVNRSKCNCSQFEAPPIKIINNKVDVSYGRK